MRVLKVQNSTSIKEMSYDKEKRILHIQFVNGRTYIYKKVSLQSYTQLLLAESKGKYLKQLQRDHAYEEIFIEETRPINNKIFIKSNDDIFYIPTARTKKSNKKTSKELFAFQKKLLTNKLYDERVENLSEDYVKELIHLWFNI